MSKESIVKWHLVKKFGFWRDVVEFSVPLQICPVAAPSYIKRFRVDRLLPVGHRWRGDVGV